ncbi:unnamed protein product [Microthlaspi erraticum]|uniref:Reverse transcriptase domain-containing protein n=1 Tax=Microthlaspi erraticum TaxID=1685480 RepID=A0A6D2ILT7_9BRAS|nr:unnamed protein product [Microthlaspi erraticum]
MVVRRCLPARAVWSCAAYGCKTSDWSTAGRCFPGRYVSSAVRSGDGVSGHWPIMGWMFLGRPFHTVWTLFLVNYSYLVNDRAHGAIIPERGIRQGDPLSPYLFILCGEVLSGLCRKAQLNGRLPGIKVARRCPPVNHLLFADDPMFFCKASRRNCDALVNILKNYETASGQKINVEKSSITFANKTNGETKTMAKEILGIAKTGGQGNYLGLPEHFGRRKKDLFSIIVDRIRNRLVSWSTKFLSGAGKMTMLKSVLSAIPTYTMSCFKLSKSLCKRIQSVMTHFW